MHLARLVSLGVALSCAPLALADGAAAPAAPYDPTQNWEVNYESGVLWRFTGDATRLAYTLEPQLLTLETPLVGTPRNYDSVDVVLRSRFSLLLEPISMGPEHHFIGASASGIMEWWNKRRTGCLFFSAGGGIGWLDSKGHQVSGGQGEDFNLNWLAYTGVRVFSRNRLSGSVGAYFQHVSNHGMNSVNPGLNAVGPMMSVGWHF
jgi:hypothetical protein